MTSAVALARLRYSASELEREIVYCFLEDQATALQRKKMQHPVILCRSSGSLPNPHQKNPLRIGARDV